MEKEGIELQTDAVSMMSDSSLLHHQVILHKPFCFFVWKSQCWWPFCLCCMIFL